MDRRNRQLPLEFGHKPAMTRDDLIVSPANADAVALIERWPDWPSPVVILAGPAGSGKTHLASIWKEMAGARTHQASSLGDAGGNAPHLLDDADDPHLDETGLFHLINATRQAGSTLLLTARRFPGAWNVGLPDLASRLKAAVLVEIREPDDALLAGVITKLFADRQIEVEPHVIDYLVRRMERSLSTANALVERLDRAGLEQQSRITRAMAAEVMTALDEGQRQFDL